LDALAGEGMRLLNFNVEAQCTPSRSALMTGRFSIRSGTYEVPIGGGPDGLALWEITRPPHRMRSGSRNCAVRSNGPRYRGTFGGQPIAHRVVGFRGYS